MSGINYVLDEKGKPIAVQIDLKKYGDLWEDFYDFLVAEKRKDEPRESLSEVKAILSKKGKLDV